MKETPFVELRDEIDEIDQQIVHLLEKRAEIAKKLGKIKQNSQLPIVDKQREKLVLEHVKQRSKGKCFPESILQEIFRKIIQGCTQVQSPNPK